MEIRDKCTLLVNTCDKYSFLWDGFFCCLLENWEEFDMPIVLNTETLSYSFSNLNIKTFNFGSNLSWGKRLKKTLRSIKTEYVLFFLDDFWIRSKVDNEFFKKSFNYIENNKDIATISFWQTGENNINDGRFLEFELRPNKCKYKLNCHAAIWRRDYLISFIKSCYTPWEFEIYGSIAASYKKGRFYTIKSISDYNHLFDYEFGGVLYRGKWRSHDIDRMVGKYNLKIDLSQRGYFQKEEKNKKNKETILEKLKRPNLIFRIFCVVRNKIRALICIICPW